MKKVFMLGLVFGILMSFCNVQSAFADTTEATVIKQAIEKYKKKNYVGCISDLRIYTTKDPTSAIAWYYLGNAYMNIALKEEAHEAFTKVINLNTVPKLTSYSIQAQICMENPARCDYQNFNSDQIKKLKADPAAFLEQYFANLNSKTEDADSAEIKNLINGTYPQNVHPEAKEFIRQEKIKIKQNEINTNQMYAPQGNSLSQAVDLLKQQNNDITSFAMMLEKPESTTNYAEVVKQYQKENKQITPEMLQMMMMQNMMPTF